jgi:methyl-accepting chemotaxis protein
MANAGKAVTMFAQKLKARCAVLLGQDASEDRRKSEKLPCNLKIEIQTARGLVAAPVYEISMDGILICGPDAGRLPRNQSLNATLESIGACRIRLGEHSAAGAQARFEAPNAELSEKIEDKLWSIHDENTEFVTRAMEAGAALDEDFRGRRSPAAPFPSTTCSTKTMSRYRAPIRCSTAPGYWTGRIARCRRSRRLSCKRTSAWCFAR